MLRLIVIVISIACLKCSIASGQQILRGKIIEFGNSEYIPYANISLTQNEGTASDISGNFLLPIRLELAKGKLVISSIGYETKSLSLDSLLAKGEVVHQIFLKPVSFLLQEVAVQEKKLTPVDIVKEALIAITKNYLQDPFNMEFYSRVTTGPLDKPGIPERDNC